MALLFKKFMIKPNQIGFLYRKNVFKRKLEPGVYNLFNFGNYYELFCLPENQKLMAVINQEVLAKDNIAFRFSYTVTYTITDHKKFLSKFELNRAVDQILYEAEEHLRNISQILLRNKISEFRSDEINEQRQKLFDFKDKELEKAANEYGITINQATLRDLTFPKPIQDLFAKQLESKIRSQADLENARTSVATARTLKNASELMKGDENIKFFQFLETITKISAKGKHTFMIGDFYKDLNKKD